MRRNLVRGSFLGILLIAVIIALPKPSFAADELVNGTFSTSGQSLWGAGSTFSYNFDYGAGIYWHGFSVTLGPGVTCPLGCWGGDVNLYLAPGGAGAEFGFHLDSGSVSATEPASFNVMFPGTTVGAPTATVNSSFNGFGLGTLNTAAPNFSAYTDVGVDAEASVSAEACVVFCVSGSATIASIHGSMELASFNSSDGTLNLLGSSTPFSLGNPVNFVAGSLTVNSLADTSGSGSGDLYSSGSSDALSASVNVASIASLGALSGTVGIPGLLNVNWNLLTDSLNLDNYVGQKFGLFPTGVFVDYQVDQTGANYFAPVGTPVDIAFGGFNQLDVTPTFFMNASFANVTDLCVGTSSTLSALGGSVDLFGIFGGSFGPLYSDSAGFVCLGGDISVFDKQFALGGWNTIQGAPFELDSSSPSTPEPASLLLFGTGLTMLGGLVRWRRRRS